MPKLTENKIKISVRGLVEFMLRDGDLDNRRGSGKRDLEAMQAGARIHRKIQKQMGSSYQAEVPLRIEVPIEPLTLVLEGRADGIVEEIVQGNDKSTEKLPGSLQPVTLISASLQPASLQSVPLQPAPLPEDTKVWHTDEIPAKETSVQVMTDEKSANDTFIHVMADEIPAKETGLHVMIDEIKGMYTDVTAFEKPIDVHLAQAKCYGYIMGRQKALKEIDIQITYCNLDTEETVRMRDTYSLADLECWFIDLIDGFRKWALFLYEQRCQRVASTKELAFPYLYREGQKGLAVSVYRTIERQRMLFIQAATGIGKTLSVIYPVVKAMGEGLAERAFYLTAKTITRTAAEEGFRVLRRRGLHFSTVTMTAKEKLCVLDKPDCNPEACGRAKGHYDRVNEAVYALLTTTQEITREELLATAERFQVCPFEMSLDITEWVDGVICDYNYAFDPNVRLMRHFGDGANKSHIFLIDEAHNLVERARDMYSAEIYKEDVLKVKKIIKPYNCRLERSLNRLNKSLLELKRECDDFEILDNPMGFYSALREVFSELDKFLEEDVHLPEEEEFMNFYFDVRHCVNMFENVDEGYRIYSEHTSSGFKVKLFCINPAARLEECLASAVSAIFFSATLLPVSYYKKLLSIREDDYAVYASSPFPAENRLLLIGSEVSSKYTRRGPSEYQKYAEYIEAAITAKCGNYLVFFPSYAYMEEVLSFLSPWCREWNETHADISVSITAQSGRMTEAMREDFLNHFKDFKDKAEGEEKETLVGCCVMGGIFSEGIDLKGDRLIGVIIVGTGLPQVGTERKILMDYFKEKGMNGFDFSYRFPGMNKVLQSAGRVIRTDTDRGMIMLLDERFLQRDYRMLFPREWADVRTVGISETKAVLEEFWRE